MIKTWFSSDHHFGHKNIISYCNRPFRTVDGMTASLVHKWNSVVEEQDVVYYLGDLSFVPQEATDSILQRLNGTIHFIKGNHDRAWKSNRLASIKSEDLIVVEGQAIYLSHKPVDLWRFQEAGAWHLHGHLHGNKYHGYTNIPNRVDVGVDVWNYRPVSFYDLKDYFEQKNLKEKG